MTDAEHKGDEMTTPKRFYVMCVPGRRDDGADATWFVCDKTYEGKPVPCHDDHAAYEVCRLMNAETR